MKDYTLTDGILFFSYNYIIKFSISYSTLNIFKIMSYLINQTIFLYPKKIAIQNKWFVIKLFALRCFLQIVIKILLTFSDLFILLSFKKGFLGFSSITHWHACMFYHTLFIIFVHYYIHLLKGNKIFKSDNITIFNFQF